MQLGFSKVFRKLKKGKCRSIAVNGTIYYMDDQDRVFARMQNENHLSLFLTGKDGSIKTLNLVYSFKYKCNQDVVIADVAFMSETDVDRMPVISKNRFVEFAKDETLAQYEITSCGKVDANHTMLTVSVPFLNMEDVCTEVINTSIDFSTVFQLTIRAIR